MKKQVFTLLITLISLGAFAQVGINADNSNPDPSAMLDVKSSDKGVLIPRMTQAEREVISSPATGLMVYQTDQTTGFWFYNGANWMPLTSETDPKVGILSLNKVPNWNGTTLQDGLISDDGNNVSLTNDAYISDLTVGKGGGNMGVNTALGVSSLSNNATGLYNAAFGYEALSNNTDGFENVAVGYHALKSNTYGSQNTAVGLGALAQNTGASNNTAVGYTALGEVIGAGNTAVGSGAMVDLFTGYNNVAVGAGSMPGLNAGSQNTAIGTGSGALNTGDNNVFVGFQAGYNETGSGKLYIENTSSAEPLIYGDFFADKLRINGALSLRDLALDNLKDSILVARGDGTIAFRDASTLGSGGGHWTANGSDIYYSEGKVGIGGNLPTHKLTLFSTGFNEKQLRMERPNTDSENTTLYTTAGSNKWAVGMNNSPGEIFEFYSYQIGNFVMSLTPSGNVGIGTSNPHHRLSLGTPSAGKHLAIWEDGNAFFGLGNAINQLEIFAGLATDVAKMVINDNGNVGIGTTTPQSKLAVNGTITCKEVDVTLAGFPDYVFDDDYDLLSLEEVENHIKEHGHLPNVPSAEEVEENGIGLGELNKILLEKVEELTLHAIQSEKRISELEKTLRQNNMNNPQLNQN